jgi:hypothetical protein
VTIEAAVTTGTGMCPPPQAEKSRLFPSAPQREWQDAESLFIK